MKRILFSIVLMLVGMTAWAQDWTAPTENEYETSTPVYVKVNVNGTEQVKAQVAAFIGDECRAVSFAAETPMGNNFVHTLRVRGNESDVSKTITFKVAWDGLVFNFKKTVVFTGETYSEENPLILNVDMPTGVSLSYPLNIEVKLPGTYNLNNDIKLLYEGRDVDGSTIAYTPRNESTIETELTYEWDFSNSSSYFTVGDNNILKALQETGGGYLGLTISGGDGFNIGGSTTVNITEPKVPVTGISCTPSTWTININDNLNENQELVAAITVLPEDASDKTYTFVPADATAEAVYNNGFFSAAGTYNMNIVSNSDRGISATIVVTVVKSVESISLTSPTGRFYAVAGDNVFDLVRPYVSVYPSDATNQNFNFVVPAEGSDAIVDGVARRMPGLYNIEIVAEENPQIKTQVEVVINDIIAPAEITLNIGETYSSKLDGQISVLPELDNERFTYTLAPKTDADAAGFDANGGAIKSGTYTLYVTCDQNSKATTEITVTVVTPVVLTFPTNITLSKFKDTELELTFVKGDNFDPELVELRFTSHQDMPGGEPTYTAVANSNNLKWNLRANLVGYFSLEVFYNGLGMLNEEEGETSEVRVPVEIPFNNDGWDWIYYPASYSLIDAEGYYKAWLNQDANNRIIDLRSQTDLLYNDDTYGLFGSIGQLSSGDGMYKIKAKYEDAADAMFVATPQDDYYWDRLYGGQFVEKGYNWIGYPNEWDITFDEFNSIEINQAEEGDMIIGKNGFAEYENGRWVEQTGFKLQVGKGYIYYSVSEIGKNVSFDVYPANFEPSLQMNHTLTTQEAASESVWQYDAGQFADNMAIVAEIPQLDFPADYTVGAFVGDECRGKGSAVLGGKMMISVAGKAGERVTFRLHNELTGEFIDLNETLTYAQRAGSLKNPVVLTSDAIVTGIAEVEASDDAAVQGIFDLSGRRVENMNAGGIYIVKTLENGKVVARKVIK